MLSLNLLNFVLRKQKLVLVLKSIGEFVIVSLCIFHLIKNKKDALLQLINHFVEQQTDTFNIAVKECKVTNVQNNYRTSLDIQ